MNLSATSQQCTVLKCKSCMTQLATAGELVFFSMLTNGMHLTPKFELQESFLNPDIPQKTVNVEPQSDVKKLRFSPYELHCAKCRAVVGHISTMGPAKELVAAFGHSYVGLYGVDGHQIGPGKWSAVAKFVKDIDCRELNGFYGPDGTPSASSSDDKSTSLLASILSKSPIRFPTERDLQVFSLRDLSADKPRPYQIECFVAAALGNSVVYLPTGAGKTLIAAMVISLFQRLNQSKLIYFLVDRIPLAFQQANYIADQTGLTTMIACGENVDEIPVSKLRSFPVVVMTVQVLINFLSCNFLRIEDASLIVFDEIHHAVKAHPYAVLLDRFYKKLPAANRPHILGLTASPMKGSKLDMAIGLDELLALSHSSVYMPFIYQDEMTEAINRPDIKFISTEATSDMASFNEILEGFCQLVMGKICASLNLPLSLEMPCLEDIAVLRGFLRALISKAHEEANDEVTKLILFLQKLVSAAEMCNVLGPRFSKSYVAECLEDVPSHVPERSVKEFVGQIAPFDSKSSKLEFLIRILTEVPFDINTRIIVFVQTKRTARILATVLAETADFDSKWNPAAFMGRSAGQLEGMSWTDHQAPTLQKFRSGEHRLLISTSVLQEGIDVPVCNHVIIFDPSWSLTSFIQSRGRARAKESSFTLICSQVQKLTYEALMRGEEDMRVVIAHSMGKGSSMTASKILLAVSLNLKAASILNWNNRGDICHSDSAELLKKSYKTISLSIHGDNNTTALDTDILDQLPDYGLINSQSRTEDDTIFLDSQSKVTIKAEASAHANLRIAEIVRLMSDFSEKMEATPRMISFRLSERMSSSDTNTITLQSDNVGLGSLISLKHFNCVKNLCMPFKMGIDSLSQEIQLFTITDDRRVFRIEVKFANIAKFIVIDLGNPGSVTSLYVPTRCSPFFYYAHVDSTTEVKLANLDQLAWERAALREVSEFMDIYPVFKVDMFLTSAIKARFVSSVHKLEGFGIKVLFGRIKADSQLNGLITPDAFHHCIECTSQFSAVYDLKVLESSCRAAFLFRASESILQKLVSISDNMRHIFFEKVALEIGEEMLVDVDRVINRVFEGIRLTMSDTDSFCSETRGHDSQSDSTLVRFVAVTPTRFVFLPPKKLVRNRILRAFDPDFFLRVQFRDEDLRKLSSVSSGSSIKNPLLRIGEILRQGIHIGDRYFQFLAMSSSQLRDHGCWFVASYRHPESGELIDANYIRQWCGNFSEIKNVAKYVARLGQSLSASYNTASVLTHDYEMIPDDERTVEFSDGSTRNYNFTDGIGMISPALAKEISQQMGFENVPSAYQIRYAGFKGVLAVNPHIPWDDPLKKIWFRESMKKFTSNHSSLEVLNWSNYIPCFMNRQVLMILSSLGVPDEAFMSLQDRMLGAMPDMLLNTREAVTHLRQYLRIITGFSFDQALKYRIEAEAFFRSLLLAIYRKQLAELLTRSRVFVPMGRILIGAIDETGTLKEDEVFVQVSRQVTDEEALSQGLVCDSHEGYCIVHAPVVVAKNPCMHPGDVRVLKAVPHTHLSNYYYDCVVFPKTGLRPITDMCSGSDLDGDLYFITWDPTLIPQRVEEPMDYSGARAKELEEVTLNDVINFMVDFISNDQLGTIANSHVAHADTLPEGVSSPLCKQLALIFSLAVDFPKTGILPNFPPEARVKSWPDFMQKTGQISHISDKVIGKMFRRAKTIEFSGITFCVESVEVDPTFLVPGYEKYLESAKESYLQYTDMLATMLKLYCVKSEAELFGGSILMEGTLGKDDAQDAMDVISKRMKIVIASMNKAFYEGCSPTEVQQKAAAYYHVTYSNPVYPRGLKGAILSFPWIFADALLKNKQTNLSCPAIEIDEKKNVSEIGRSVVTIIKYHLQNYFLNGFIDRMNFFNLIRSHIISSSNQELSISISGSSFSWILGGGSDLNIFIDVSDEVLQESIAGSLGGSFQLTCRPGLLSYKGAPFSFTVFNCPAWHEASFEIRNLVLSSPINLVVLLAIMRWARTQNLVRRSYRHSGKFSASALSLILIRLLRPSTTDAKDYKKVGMVSEELSLITEMVNRLNRFTEKHFAAVGEAILQFFSFFGFASTIHLEELLNQQCETPVYISEDAMKYLREYSFQAYQFLAQSLDPGRLLEETHVPNDVEISIKLSKRPFKFLRRPGSNSGLFMEGSSRLLFDGSVLQTDPVSFEIHQLARRHHHLQKQCYVPVLKHVTDDDPLSSSSFLYDQYFTHATRQLDMARQKGCHEFGTPKLVAKFGCIYLINLPRLLMEDASYCTIENVQKALNLGYKTCGDVLSEKLTKPSASDASQLSMPVQIDTENKSKDKVAAPVSTDAVIWFDENDERVPKSVTAAVKKKPALSAMNSAFEPLFSDEAILRSILSKHGFICSQVNSGFSANLTLFNPHIGVNGEYRLVYDDHGVFQKMRHRPLRWLLTDVRGKDVDYKDYRISFASSASVDLDSAISQLSEREDCSENVSLEILRKIRAGVVEIDSDPISPQTRLRVIPEFRSQDRLLVRSSHADIYALPTIQAAEELIDSQNELMGVDKEILSTLKVVFCQVTEYSGMNPDTGYFSEIHEKSELELQVIFDWDTLKGPNGSEFSQKLISSMWRICHFFRRNLFDDRNMLSS